MSIIYEELDTLPDEELVGRIKNGSDHVDKSISVLINRHSGLYVSTVMKVTGNADVPNLTQDMLDDKLAVLFQSASSFDEKRGTKFSTHFANEAKWHCLKNKCKKSNREITAESDTIDFLLNQGEPTRSNLSDEDINTLNRIVSEELSLLKDKRIAKIIRLRYFCEGKKKNPWKNVAKEVQLSIQGCIDAHNKGIEQIRKNIKRKYKGKLL